MSHDHQQGSTTLSVGSDDIELKFLGRDIILLGIDHEARTRPPQFSNLESIHLVPFWETVGFTKLAQQDYIEIDVHNFPSVAELAVCVLLQCKV